jgi:cystathionine gamma-synthase
MHPHTLAIHTGSAPDPQTGAIAPALHLSTTFEHAADVAEHSGYLYQRYTDPTVERLEAALCALDCGAAALHYATGLAAGSSVLQCLPPGAHVLMADDSYFAFRRIAQTMFERWGLSWSVVDMSDVDAVRVALRPETGCLWIETPSNPLIKLSDVQALAELARSHGAISVVDATFATPMVLRPLKFGADVVLHSSTKYFGGHSDVMGGALIFREAGELHAACAMQRKLLGASSAPFNSWLVHRGLKTLPCRMDWHQRNAMAIADFLAAHPRVEAVHYPGLAEHPQHALALRQMSGFGGMLSFRVHGGRAAAIAVASRLRLIHNATSLGAVESLIEHRQSVEGPDSSTPANLLRLSVGLEHVDDLIEDLREGLNSVGDQPRP